MLDLLTARQAAETAGVTRRTITRWIAAGRLSPAAQLPGQTGALLFRPDDVEAARQSHRTAAAIGEHAIDGQVVVQADDLTTVVTGHAS